MNRTLMTKDNNQTVIESFIYKYQNSTKNAVESILNMGEAVFEIYTKAKAKELTEEDLDFFCKSVNLDLKSSTFRKYKSIGQNANRFRVVMDKLPATFSVLYEMATLSGDDFERLVMNKSYSKSISLDQFKKMMQKSTVLTGNKMINRPILYFSPKTVAKVIQKINRFNISIMRDVPQEKFEEIVDVITSYRNNGWLQFEDPEIIEYGASRDDDLTESGQIKEIENAV